MHLHGKAFMQFRPASMRQTGTEASKTPTIIIHDLAPYSEVYPIIQP